MMTLRIRFAATLCVLFVAAAPARAEGTYWTTPDLLRAFFPSSEKVTYVEVPRAPVEKALGEPVKKEKYVVFVAKTGARIDGYAVIDDEKGEHQPITFGIKLTPDGRVERTEVMAYREAYGEEIREQRFQKQFAGRPLADARAFRDGVVAISGATISSRSMTIAVRRALALTAVARETTTPPPPPAPTASGG
jgi:Na+-translocating ferredoxin:NAD+ oxidoreductase RnfG subunit